MDLQHKAKELWKDEYNRQAWIRAVCLLKTTKKGWLLDTKVKKHEPTR